MSSLFGIGGGGNVGAAGGSFYETTIDQSLRLNGVDSNLARTHTAGDRQKFTWSGWVKYNNNKIFSCFEAFSNGTNFTQFVINTNGQPSCYHIESAVDYGGDTVFRLRDPSAWYHIVWRIDTTQASAGDRIRVYVNGELRETNPFTNYGSIPQNTNTHINTALTHRMGYNQNVGGGGAPTTQANAFGNGYLADVHFCDGQSYAPTEFGETSNGIWVPITPSVTYGTNGFHLGFSDTSAIGDDTSGQGNDWTVDDIAASDVVPDSPTNNFATWNSAGRVYGATNVPTFSEGNLKSVTGSYATANISTFAINPTDTTGYYWEVKIDLVDSARSYIGIIAPENKDLSGNGTSYGWPYKYILSATGDFFGSTATNSTGTVAQTSYTTGDILMFAYKEGKIWIGKNGTWMNSGDPAAGTGNLLGSDGSTPSDRGAVTWYPYAGYNLDVTANFGQDSTFAGTETAGGNSDENGYADFKYAVPSGGFLAMCSANLPEPAIGPNSDTTSDEHFNTVTYTGTGASNSITVGFQPDATWIKSRSNAYNHQLVNSVVGYPNGTLLPDATDAEYTAAARVDSRDSNGFTVSTPAQVNLSSGTFVSWNWKAGGTAVSNTDGSITSSVSANPDAGFSIVSYEGTGSNATIGHGLSAAPELIIIKERDNANGWAVSIKGDATDFLRLDTTAAQSDDAAVFNDTAPTSTVFSIGTAAMVNRDSMIAYCFHSVEGFSKVGTYVGNGSTDGTFVYTGFRPAFVMVKNTDTSSHHWSMYDNARSPYNVVNKQVYANLSNAESTGDRVDFLSNGFKARFNTWDINPSGVTHIYIAFAEAPFKYANAR
jgi:hypothetical protein